MSQPSFFKKKYVHLILTIPGKPYNNWPPSACGKCWQDFKSSNRTKDEAKVTCPDCRVEIDKGGTEAERYKRVVRQMMSHILYAAEIPDDRDKRRHHKITYEGYQETRTLNAFFSNSRKINADKKRGVIWISHGESSHRIETETAKELNYKNLWNELPIIGHESMWSFYKYIGYDYKTKKWSKPLCRDMYPIDFAALSPKSNATITADRS